MQSLDRNNDIDKCMNAIFNRDNKYLIFLDYASANTKSSWLNENTLSLVLNQRFIGRLSE